MTSASPGPDDEAGRRAWWQRPELVIPAVLGFLVVIVLLGRVAAPKPRLADSAPGSIQEQTSAWNSGGGLSILTRLSAASSGITTAQSPTELRSWCQSLQRAADDGNRYLPLPDEQAQAEWATTLADLGNVSRGCLAGNVNSATTVAQVDDATAHLRAVQQRMAVAAGR